MNAFMMHLFLEAVSVNNALALHEGEQSLSFLQAFGNLRNVMSKVKLKRIDNSLPNLLLLLHIVIHVLLYAYYYTCSIIIITFILYFILNIILLLNALLFFYFKAYFYRLCGFEKCSI